MIERKHKGAWAELTACAWLLRQGYEVFRNVSPHGAIDVMAAKNGAVFKFDIKSIGPDSAKPYLSEEQIAAGILPLYVRPDGTCEIEATPSPGFRSSDIACKHCKIVFAPTSAHNVFCSHSCRYQAHSQHTGKYPVNL